MVKKNMEAASEPAVDLTMQDVIKRVLKDRGVTAEQVLAAVFDILAEDFVNLLPVDEQPLDTPYGQAKPLPRAVTALAFRRLMQRMCVINFDVAKAEDDESASDHDWMNAMISRQSGDALAAAVEVFDGASVLTAKQIEQQKYEAEVMGEPDPYPHIQFAAGSQTEMRLIEPPADAADGPLGAKPSEKTVWN